MLSLVDIIRQGRWATLTNYAARVYPVLVAYSDSHEDQRRVKLAVPDIAKYAGLSVRAVQYGLSELESARWLVVSHAGGGRSATTYRLLVSFAEGLPAVQPVAPVQKTAPPLPVPRPPRVVQPAAPVQRAAPQKAFSREPDEHEAAAVAAVVAMGRRKSAVAAKAAKLRASATVPVTFAEWVRCLL